MKSYTSFIQEAVAVPETVKSLKKRFKGTKDVKKSSTKKQLKGSKVAFGILTNETQLNFFNDQQS